MSWDNPTQADLARSNALCSKAEAERDAAIGAAAAMRSALELYADESNWHPERYLDQGPNGGAVEREGPSIVDRAGSEIAVNALRDTAGAELLAERERLRKLCGEAAERILYAWRVLLRDQWLEADSEPYRALGERLKEAADGK